MTDKSKLISLLSSTKPNDLLVISVNSLDKNSYKNYKIEIDWAYWGVIDSQFDLDFVRRSSEGQEFVYAMVGKQRIKQMVFWNDTGSI